MWYKLTQISQLSAYLNIHQISIVVNDVQKNNRQFYRSSYYHLLNPNSILSYLSTLFSLSRLSSSVILCSCIFISPLAQAALSTTTAGTIQGSKPYIKVEGVRVDDLDELVSFYMPDGAGGKKGRAINNRKYHC